MKIKLVKDSDKRTMMEVALRSFEEDKNKYGGYPPEIDTLNWHNPNQFNGVYYKLIKDNEIIGGFRVIDKGNNHYYFASVFIEPKYQNLGYGSDIMNFIKVKYPDVKKWTLDTPYKSYRNHYFYEKHGFKKVGEFKPNKTEDFILFVYELVLE